MVGTAISTVVGLQVEDAASWDGARPPERAIAGERHGSGRCECLGGGPIAPAGVVLVDPVLGQFAVRERDARKIQCNVLGLATEVSECDAGPVLVDSYDRTNIDRSVQRHRDAVRRQSSLDLSPVEDGLAVTVDADHPGVVILAGIEELSPVDDRQFWSFEQEIHVP